MWTTALGFSIIDKLTSVIVNSETASSSLCPHAPTWASELKHFDSQRGFPFSRVTCEMLFCAQEETKPRQNTAESKQNQAPIVFRLLTKYPGVQTFPFKGRKPLEQWGGLWKSQSTEDAFPPRAGKQNFKLIFKKKIKFTNLIMTLWGGNAAVIFLWPRNSWLLQGATKWHKRCETGDVTQCVNISQDTSSQEWPHFYVLSPMMNWK